MATPKKKAPKKGPEKKPVEIPRNRSSVPE